ncbi:uncharacterized protein LOC133850139 [Drosophila sulfurigaster albostrigata]|uniref:uncharacterized protein LOC133850139 n=1 Tax=Drosophila sulfurigaster albostrigata TaxID=89887 RepID=UPI002D219507|nr:uncharacterized protein LOC133850139 [Drosophila sulfurigaster albostrigata]
MDQDLDFMINALSRSSSPLCNVFGREQLMEMRHSFIMLQRLLRSHPMDIGKDMDKNINHTRYPVRVKAGGNTDWNVPRATATELPSVVRTFQFPPRKMNKATQNSKSSVLSSSDRQLNITRSVTNAASESSDRPASCSENAQALVPYQLSQELVRYTPPSDNEDDDEDEDEAVTAGESETLCPNDSLSIVSLRIPMEMEYVWYNGDFGAESTDSEMTIIADGCNFILSN